MHGAQAQLFNSKLEFYGFTMFNINTTQKKRKKKNPSKILHTRNLIERNSNVTSWPCFFSKAVSLLRKRQNDQ